MTKKEMGSKESQRKKTKFHLISWCGHFVEKHSFRRVSEFLCGSCAFPQNFHTRKLGEITVVYVVNFLRKIISPTLIIVSLLLFIEP